jgi:hypothetical protein
LQEISESAKNKLTNNAALLAAFFAALVTGDDMRVFFFTTVAPLVNVISNESIAEIFSRMLLPRSFLARGQMNARIQSFLQTAGQFTEKIKDCGIKIACVLFEEKKNGEAVLLASTFGRKPRHVAG